MRLGDEPARFWGPLLAHWFPALAPADMGDVYLHDYVAMHDLIRRSK